MTMIRADPHGGGDSGGGSHPLGLPPRPAAARTAPGRGPPAGRIVGLSGGRRNDAGPGRRLLACAGLGSRRHGRADRASSRAGLLPSSDPRRGPHKAVPALARNGRRRRRRNPGRPPPSGRRCPARRLGRTRLPPPIRGPQGPARRARPLGLGGHAPLFRLERGPAFGLAGLSRRRLVGRRQACPSARSSSPGRGRLQPRTAPGRGPLGGRLRPGCRLAAHRPHPERHGLCRCPLCRLLDSLGRCLDSLGQNRARRASSGLRGRRRTGLGNEIDVLLPGPAAHRSGRRAGPIRALPEIGGAGCGRPPRRWPSRRARAAISATSS